MRPPGSSALALLSCMLVPVGPLGAAGTPPDLSVGVPLHVLETHGVDRHSDPITFAFPLPLAEDIRDPADLVVLDPEAVPVASQMRVTQRWNGLVGDPGKPIRWLLIDLQVSVPAGQEAIYLVKRRADEVDPEPPALDVSVTTDLIEVATGCARIELDGDTMNLIDRFHVDLNGDDFVKNGESVIDRPRKGGFEVKDRFGDRYHTDRWPVVWTVEEQGPLRTVIRADGRHGPKKPNSGIGRDFFQYRTRFSFYAGQSFVRVQHSLRNAYLEGPLGSIRFDGYRMYTQLSKKFAKRKLKTNYGLDSGEPYVVKKNSKSRLLQDSHGGASWSESSGTSFKGFKLFNKKNKVAKKGGQASGYIHVHDRNAGFAIAMRDWFENFPKAFGFDGKRQLTFDILPADFAMLHWLDDGQQKTTDFLLFAHGTKGAPPLDIISSYLRPMRPFPDPEWTRSSDAWGDQGDLDDPPYSHQAMRDYDDGKLGSLYAGAFINSSYSFGWTEFGEMTWARNTHTTGSPRNKLTYFDKFVMSGSQSAFRISELFALHSRDIRTYHIDGFSRELHPNATLWEALPVWSHSTDKVYRDTLDPALDPHRAGIPPGGHGWNAFDMEHFTVDDLYEHYLMTGDWVTLDSLRAIGEVVRTWPIYSLTKAPGSSRGVGWTMRAMVKIYQVTGDPRFLDAADDLVASVAATYGQSPSPDTGLIYHYVTRYPPHANHIPDDDYDLPWQLACVIHGMLLHHRETGDPTSRQIALDVADYLIDFGWNGVAMDEALAVDDHDYVNPKFDNAGINTWIPSALILAYRENPRPAFPLIAEAMYNSIPGLTDPLSYNGYGIHHWWHSLKALQLGY